MTVRVQRANVDYGRLSFMIIFSVIFYNEIVVYFRYYAAWPELEQSSPVLKILFVADPQILGFEDQDNVFVSWIARWDSDRYLSKTFSWATYAFTPDVVVFLGDLLNEGSECNDVEFQSYVRRFKGIFDSKAVKIYVAGDNDIGGEGSDPITPHKVERFKKNFPIRSNYFFQWNDDKVVQRYELDKQDDENKKPMIEIIPANILTFKSTEQDWFDVTTEPHANVKFRLVVSHMPILPTPNPSFSKEVMARLKPHLIFSAHDHRGLDFSTSKIKSGPSTHRVGNITFFTQEDEESLITLSSSDDLIHEIIVPTSNYRMGVREMAFGLGVVNFEDNTMTYVNLWLPSRFPLLYVYLASLSIAFSLYLIGKGKRRRPSTPKSRSRSSSINYTKLV